MIKKYSARVVNDGKYVFHSNSWQGDTKRIQWLHGDKVIHEADVGCSALPLSDSRLFELKAGDTVPRECITICRDRYGRLNMWVGSVYTTIRQ